MKVIILLLFLCGVDGCEFKFTFTPTTKPATVRTHKVWKKVRPTIQIEGMIDDGYELVEVEE